MLTGSNLYFRKIPLLASEWWIENVWTRRKSYQFESHCTVVETTQTKQHFTAFLSYVRHHILSPLISLECQLRTVGDCVLLFKVVPMLRFEYRSVAQMLIVWMNETRRQYCKINITTIFFLNKKTQAHRRNLLQISHRLIEAAKLELRPIWYQSLSLYIYAVSW